MCTRRWYSSLALIAGRAGESEIKERGMANALTSCQSASMGIIASFTLRSAAIVR